MPKPGEIIDRWNEDETRLLVDCIAARMSDADIYALLPNRSLRAISNKKHYLKFGRHRERTLIVRKYKPKTLTCLRCSNTFTVATAGRFLYCTPCGVIKHQEWLDKKREASRNWNRNHPGRNNLYQKQRNAAIKELLKDPAVKSKFEQLKVQVHGTESGG